MGGKSWRGLSNLHVEDLLFGGLGGLNLYGCLKSFFLILDLFCILYFFIDRSPPVDGTMRLSI